MNSWVLVSADSEPRIPTEKLISWLEEKAKSINATIKIGPINTVNADDLLRSNNRKSLCRMEKMEASWLKYVRYNSFYM